MTESEEMYLVTIARLKESGLDGPVPLSRLAGELDVQSVSVNQMVRKLEESGLVEYIPYKGVQFTESGNQIAGEILRSHRLWEVFLVERLGYTPKQANPLACRLEHALPREATERLASFLGQPTVCPGGSPIPAADATQTLPREYPLTSLPAGSQGYLSRITAGLSERAFLSANGLQAGTEVELLATGKQGDCLVAPRDAQPIHLAAALCGDLYLQVKA
ncbi:MAG: metal-dependent transcriptional regulator [Anaerolineaceae bacterium]|nr:metal-dependent transcriptional regulator [Anaerolineaceae bacterium]